MVTIGANGNKIVYGIKHYNLDTEQDINAIDVRKEIMGCTCFIIETSKYYMLNSSLRWIEITPFGKVISSGGDEPGGDEPGGDEPTPPDVEDVIYDGGDV